MTAAEQKNDDLRAKFEAWSNRRGHGDFRRDGTRYVNVVTQSNWTGFQAAASLYAKDAERLREALTEITAIKPADVNLYAKGWVEHFQKIARAALEGETK